MAFVWIPPARSTGRLDGGSRPGRAAGGLRRIAAALITTLAILPALASAASGEPPEPAAGVADLRPEAASVGSEVSALVRLVSPAGIAGLIVVGIVLTAPTFRRLARLGPEVG